MQNDHYLRQVEGSFITSILRRLLGDWWASSSRWHGRRAGRFNYWLPLPPPPGLRLPCLVQKM